MASKQFNSVDGYSVGSVATIVVDANSNISGNAITATANVTSPRFISNVATGTAPFVVNSTTQVANLNVATAGTAGSATTAGTVTTAAQPNITSVGTLTSLGVNGTVTAVAFTANTGVFTGNGSGLSAIAGANVTGTVSSATTATTAGTVTTAAQPNITSVGTLTSLGVSGNITAANITANTGVFTGSGSGLTTLNASNISSGTLAQARLANASVTLGSTALTLGSTVTTVAGLSSVTSTTFVGTLSGAATTAGTVTTAAQPNITSTGTLTSLTVSGNANFDSGTLFVDSVNNEVGIGTTTPSANLDVIGNTRIQSNIAYVSPNGANTINSTMLNGGTLAWSGNAGQLFSITDSMTGNIFTVNDVSGIPMISVDAGGNIQFAASGGFVSYGVTTGITAAGSTQGTATSLTRPINVVSTVSASTGVILPTVPAGARIVVMNTSGTALNVYPPSGAAINSGSTNAAYSMPAGTRLEFISVSTTQWYTLNATYG